MSFSIRHGSIAGAVLFYLGSVLSGFSQHDLPPGFPHNIRLDRVVHGEAAVRALGDRLPEVASFYQQTPNELRTAFRSDRSLKADPQGRLFFACEFQAATNAPEQGAAIEAITPIDKPPFSTSQTFLLHSRPGASRVIYLDFNGHTDTSGNWKASGASEPPFDIDDDPGTFNSTECNRIIYIWQRVSEDYSMYDIDVTTEDPGIEALRKSNSSDENYGVRVVVGGSSYDWYGKGVGGVAWVGSFHWASDTPCWVFPLQLGPNNEKYIAEACSHEAGHTLGLIHDGTSTKGYYSGQGNWAPIMGVGFNKPIVQWSKGEYADASTTQDDLAVMVNNGAVYRADDHGNTMGSATALSSDSSSSVSTNGVIGRNTDVDFFGFTAAGGSITITAARPPRDSNLRMQVILYDGGGTPILTNTPADSSTSGTQSAVNTLSLAAGNYYVSVRGTGNGNPLTTGYSDYASLGQYTITVSGTAPPGSVWLPTAAGNYSWTNLPHWSPSPPNGAGAIAQINNNIGGNQTINLPSAITLGTLNLGDANDTRAFSLQPAGGSLTFNNGSFAAALNKLSGLDDVIALPVTLVSNLTVSHSALGTLMFSGAMGGAGGSLTKIGTGTTAMSGTNSYAGPTTVSDGVLRIDNPNALPNGNLTLDGGVLGLAGGDLTNRTLGTGTAQVQWINDGGFAAYGGTRSVQFSNAAINWTAAGFIGKGRTLILGAADANGTLNWKQPVSLFGGARTVQVEDGAADIDAIFSGVISGGTTNNAPFTKTGNGTLAFTANNSYSGDTLISAGTLMLGDGTGNTGRVSPASQTVTILSGATLAINRTNIISQGASSSLGNNAPITGEGSVLVLGGNAGTGGVTMNQANTFTGGVTLNNGTFKFGTDGVGDVSGPLGNGGLFTINGGIIDNDGTTARVILNGNPISVGGDFAFGGTGDLTLPGVVDLGGATRTITNNGAATLTLAGTISNGGLTKTGPGTLILDGTNTFSGVLTINAGALSAGLLANGGSASGIGAASASATNLVIDGGTLKYTGPAVGINRGFTVGLNGATIDVSDASGQLQNQGVIAFSGSGAHTLTAITGSGSLRLWSGSGIGDGTGGATTVVKQGSGTLLLGGASTYTGPLQIQGGIVQYGNANAGGESSGVGHSVAISSGAQLKFRHGGADVVTYNADISGDGSVTFNYNNISSGGSLTLGGANTFAGGLTIAPTSGTNILPLKAGSTTALGTGDVTIGQYGKLDLNGFDNTIGLLISSGANGLVVNDGVTDATLTLNGTTTQTYGGVIQDGSRKVSLVKSGAGTQILSGANSYTGDTVIRGGTLNLTGAGTLGTGTNLVLDSGATLDVTAIAGLTLAAGQVLRATNGATATLAGNVNASSGALAIAYGNGSPTLNVTGGSLTLAAGTVTAVQVNNGGTLLPGGDYKLVSASGGGAVTGAAPTALTLSGDVTNTATLSITSGELYLHVPTSVLYPPTLSGITKSGGDMIISFSGTSGQTYQVLTSTNVTLPLASWTSVVSGTFSGAPVYYTNSSATEQRRFFVITSP